MTVNIIPLSENPRGRACVIIITIFAALDILFVAARLYSRKLKCQKLDFNDWAIIVTTLILLVHAALEIYIVLYMGIGLNLNVVVEQYGGLETIIEGGKALFGAFIIWCIANLTVKLSVLHLYLVLFRPVLRFRQATYFLMGFCTTAMAGLALAGILLCTPVAFQWDFTIPDGRCGNVSAYLASSVIVNTVLDVCVFLLPMPLLRKLNVPKRKKNAIIMVFGFGLCICIMGGIRLIWVFEIDTANLTYTILIPAVFGQVEPQLVVISACLPMLTPVLARVSESSVMRKTRDSVNAWTGRISRGDGTAVASAKSFSKFTDGRQHKLDDLNTKISSNTSQSDLLNDLGEINGQQGDSRRILITTQYSVTSQSNGASPGGTITRPDATKSSWLR